MAGGIDAAFARLASQGRKALIPYVTAGYPRRGDTVDVLEALVSAGADIIELGIPFSDPLADGPTIQASSFQALQGGTTLESALEQLRSFRRRHDTPVVLFSYLNPLLKHGIEAFVTDAVEAGADGVLVTDLPTGADPELESRLAASPLDLIRLVAPTTPPERIGEVVEGGSGFVYYISRTGVTGARAQLRATLAEEVSRVRERVALPVAVGFGISTPEQAADVARLADGVVVGSALVRALGTDGIDAAAAFLTSLREAMDAGVGVA